MNRKHHSDPDGVDPIAAAFDGYVRPPRDVVPPRRHDEFSTAELDVDALAGTTTTVAYYEVTADGITRHEEQAIITRPITTSPERNDER